MKNTTQKIVLSSLFAAIICVATMIIKIPTPYKGYINLGDSLVILSAFVLPPFYSFFAAAIGSSLADLLSGYPLYIPATFVIKGLMALAAGYILKKFALKKQRLVYNIAAAVAAELIMMLGYFGFEWCIYGFAPSVLNIPANLVQGAFGLVLAPLLINLFQKKRFS